MLVLRECARCNKTDDALLQPGADNEKVLFLSRWFHCVRIPMDVLEPDHPFHELFPGKTSEHLFVTTTDGALKVSLESDTSRTQLCEALTRALVYSYEKDPNPLYKELHVYGDQLDALDMEVRDLETKRTKLMEERVPDKKKLAKIDDDIAVVKKRIDAKLAEIEKTSKIKLKPGKAPAVKAG